MGTLALWTLLVLGLFEDLYLEPEAMAGHLALLEGSPMALFYEPALLRSEPGAAVLVSQPFGIPGVFYGRMAFVAWQWGVGVTTLRASAYQEVSLHGGWAGTWRGGRYGIALWGLQIQADTSQQHAVGLDAGTVAPLLKFRLALRIRAGLWPSWFWKSYPLRLGASLKVGSNPVMALDWELEEGYEPEWRLSALYQLTSRLWLGTGLSLSPPQWTLLWVLPWHPDLLYAIRVHPQLGLTHALELRWLSVPLLR